jgi:uncharacterized protein YndB with AHSA1/START domain
VNTARIVRLLHAPRPLVFAWWADAEKLQQWSGCKEAVSCRVTMDFRVGGAFTQQMKLSVNGGLCDFTLTGVYEEIVVPEKIVYGATINSVPTRVTVKFADHAEGTEVVLTHEGLPDDFTAAMISQGTSESFDKLAARVSGQTAGSAR